MNYYTDVLKKYAVFEGRARRSEYWYFLLFNLIASIIIGVIGGMLDFKQLASIYSLAVLVPSIAVTVRRLHDTNHSGLWFLIGLIPIIGWIVLLILTIRDGDAGPNRYGPNPKGITTVPVAPAVPPTPPTPETTPPTQPTV